MNERDILKDLTNDKNKPAQKYIVKLTGMINVYKTLLGYSMEYFPSISLFKYYIDVLSELPPLSDEMEKRIKNKEFFCN